MHDLTYRVTSQNEGYRKYLQTNQPKDVPAKHNMHTLLHWRVMKNLKINARWRQSKSYRYGATATSVGW